MCCFEPRAWSNRPTTWFWFPPPLVAVVKLFVRIPVVGLSEPAVLAAGKNFSNASDVGLSRLAGIWFPAKVVAGPLKFGQATGVETVPPQGSLIAVGIAE